MVQQIALIWFKPGVTAEQVSALREAMAALQTPGRLDYQFNLDHEMQAGSSHAAVVATFVDEAAYRAYDCDPEHDRIRRELASAVIDRVERCHVQV